jgi:hypothetical protein
MNPKKRFRKIHLPRLTVKKHMISRQFQNSKKFQTKRNILRTSHVLRAYTGRQRTVWRKAELVRVKLRVKCVLVKMDIQYPHGGIDKGPWHNKRLSVDTFTYNIERLTRAANIRLFPSLGMTRATPSTGVIVSIHGVKNVLPRKFTHAHRAHDIPNGYYACRIDSQRVHSVAEEYGAHEARPAYEYEFRYGRERLCLRYDLAGFECRSMRTRSKTASTNPTRRNATTTAIP